jgi:hypothetical protein
MVDHRLAVGHLRAHRKMAVATIGLLLMAFFESLYLSCYREPSPLFCQLSWIYVGLAGVVVFVVWFYRK